MRPLRYVITQVGAFQVAASNGHDAYRGMYTSEDKRDYDLEVPRGTSLDTSGAVAII